MLLHHCVLSCVRVHDARFHPWYDDTVYIHTKDEVYLHTKDDSVSVCLCSFLGGSRWNSSVLSCRKTRTTMLSKCFQMHPGCGCAYLCACLCMCAAGKKAREFLRVRVCGAWLCVCARACVCCVCVCM